MPPALASLTRLQKFVASVLVANPDDMSYAAATLADQGKYSPEHITDAILYIDLEVIRVGQDTIGWGYRKNYGAEQAVINGGSIEGHPGQIGHVEIQKESGDEWRRGIRAQSIDALNKFLDNPGNRYGSASITGGRYYIDEEMRFYFTGNTAQIWTPSDLAIAATCQAPAVYEPTIARGAIAMLAKDPLDPNLFGFYNQQYQADLARIKGLSEAIPPLDMFVKQGG